jgi:hypothetical protein
MSAHTGSDPNCVNVSIGAINSSHICIRSPDDANRLYVLLATYAQDPARAALVTEVTIDTAYLSRGCASNSFYTIDEKIVSNESISLEAHIGLKNYVQSLESDDETSGWDMAGLRCRTPEKE